MNLIIVVCSSFFYKLTFYVAVDIMDGEDIPLTVDNSKMGNSMLASSGSL